MATCTYFAGSPSAAITRPEMLPSGSLQTCAPGYIRIRRRYTSPVRQPHRPCWVPNWEYSGLKLLRAARARSESRAEVGRGQHASWRAPYSGEICFLRPRLGEGRPGHSRARRVRAIRYRAVERVVRTLTSLHLQCIAIFIALAIHSFTHVLYSMLNTEQAYSQGEALNSNWFLFRDANSNSVRNPVTG